MFESFFPKPKLFLLTTILWMCFSIALWYAYGQALGALCGFHYQAHQGVKIIGLGYFVTPAFLWFDVYFWVMTSFFAGTWYLCARHPWQRWSVWGTALIVFLAYIVVQVSVVINAWFGPFTMTFKKR